MRKRLTVIIALSFVISTILGTTGCNVEEDVFPDIVFSSESNETSLSSDYSGQIDNGFHELTVALPVNEETVNLLLKLYYAKNNDLFPSEMNGGDISIEYLNAINTPWVVNTVFTTNNGESTETLQALEDEGILPDIFLAYDMNSLISDGIVQPFDQYLSSDESLLSSGIYLNELEALRYGDSHYGIPFYSSVYLLAGSREYLPDDGVPSYSMSADELHEYIRSIPGINSDGSVYITRFYDADSLTPFLGEDYSLMIANEGLSSVTDSFGADPRVSRTCGMWLMNSAETDTWNTYYPDGLYFTMLPSENINAVVYPLCLSADSDDAEFAADFAAFICYDRDAQMLLRRLESLRGFFPPVSARGVWDEMSADEVFGAQSMLYEQYMPNAVFTVAGD
ncbi:MAG: hypothetical protein ILA15_11835 [Clostridiales bacterium]|nr:hypothetical protein [Clostridiales bacterium]